MAGFRVLSVHEIFFYSSSSSTVSLLVSLVLGLSKLARNSLTQGDKEDLGMTVATDRIGI